MVCTELSAKCHVPDRELCVVSRSDRAGNTTFKKWVTAFVIAGRQTRNSLPDVVRHSSLLAVFNIL